MGIVETTFRDSVLVAQFNHANDLNPMSSELGDAVCGVCQETEANPAIRALVLTGGNGRSFCAGGDFKEVAQISGRAAVEAYIDRWIDFYSTILNVTKPIVAAVDGYAIGVGFQVALSCDWRVGSPATKLIMWEVKHGIACTIGGYMLESHLGRAAMTDIIYGCEAVPVSWAMDHKLLHEVADSNVLLERAIARAQTLGGFPEVSFRKTKESINRRFIAGLYAVANDAKEAHVASAASNAVQRHIDRVLKR